jgi:hypothetical protein
MTGILSGEICSPFALRLYNAVRYDNKEIFGGILSEIIDAVNSRMPEGKERDRRLKVVMKNGDYVMNNWDAVQNMRKDGSIGSCTEAMVSHVFSERFSRNPMGWSKPGLSKLSMIRIFIKNGGRVSPLDIGVDKLSGDEKRIVMTRVEKYDSLVREQNSKIFDGCYDWRWFDYERVTDIAPSGTKVLLDALGRMRNNL